MLKHGATSASIEFVLLILLGILLGIPYALTKISLGTIPPITMVAARVALAAISLWIFIFALKRQLPQRKDLVTRLFIQGGLACVLPYLLLAFGQRSVDSALAAILNSTTPLFVYLINSIWTRNETPTLGRLSGILLGLAGVIIVIGTSSLASLGQSTQGQAMIFLATLCSAVSVIHGRRFSDIPPEVTAAGTLTSAAVVLVPLCFIVEAPLRSTPSAASIVALLVNAVFVTAVGFIIYFRLIKTVGSMATASASYLKPAVGVVVGLIFMSESLAWTSVAGLMAILVGVATINQRSSYGAASWHAFGVRLRRAGPVGL
jgi:drug/metabolite transporter (DMT)-like permease